MAERSVGVCVITWGADLRDSTVCLDSALGPADGDGAGDTALGVRRDAMRSTNDRRVTLPSAEVSEAEDRGDVRLRVLGLSTGTLLPMPLPIELERPLEEGVSVRRGVNTLPDPCRLEGVHVGLEVRADWRLGAGALIEGLDDDLLEKGLERIVTDGLLPSNDERDGETERDAPGVNDGLDGAVARGLLRVDEGPDRAIEDDPPERNAEPELRENPDLELELVAPPRLEPR